MYCASSSKRSGGAGLPLMDARTNPTVQLASTADAAELKLSGVERQHIITPWGP
jgi:hypothetical protein